jgi:hypothetical protein
MKALIIDMLLFAVAAFFALAGLYAWALVAHHH